MSDALLVVEDLHTTFHTSGGDVRAVDGVGFTLRAGETLGLVGESGSGKSVLGRTVMGLIDSDATTTVTGRVLLAGHDVHAMPRKQRRTLWGNEVAMVFQDPMTSLNPVKRVGTHLTETLRHHLHCSRSEARDRAVDLLRQVGIPEPARRAKQYPHELSGGMRQRVVIAMALACGPRLLIADEPTTALDVTIQAQILALMRELQAETGTAVILITHDLGVVADLGMAMVLVSHDLGAVAGRTERVQVMYAGRTVEAGGTRAMFEGPVHPYTAALLASIPHLENPPHTPLQSIEGTPPDMTAPPAGCRFAPRCPRAVATCTTDLPLLLAAPATADREVACHLPLVGTDAREKELTDGR